MVSPNQEAENRDGDRRERYEAVAEDAFAREARNDLSDDAHRRQDHDVDGGMGIEPEQMLEQDRIASEFGVEDAEVQSAFGGNHHEGDCEDRRAQELNNAGGVVRPDKQRKARPREARGAHAMDGNDEVQAGEDGRESSAKDSHSAFNYFSVRLIVTQR